MFALDLYRQLAKDPGNVVASLNSEPFIALTRDAYGAALERLDFKTQPEPARAAINSWVAEQTHQKILDLLPPGSVDAATAMVLTNAIYFHGTWAHKFDAKQTKGETFTDAMGHASTVPTMHGKWSMRFAQLPEVRLVEMPYLGSSLAMTWVLPENAAQLGAIEKGLSPSVLNRWLGALRQGDDVDVRVPKFKVTQAVQLKKVLSTLGVAIAFSMRADFTGIVNDTGSARLHLSEVFHKAFIDVSEEGTEAAAATAVTTVEGMAQRLTYYADHPFIYLIRDTESGTNLFMGRVDQPPA
ncbi:MAG: hypothetical protein NVSMB1_13470 [Polyangiales bacterium]